MDNLINSSILSNITNLLGQNSIKLPIEILNGDISKLPISQNLLIEIEFPNSEINFANSISKLNIQLENEMIELFGKIKLSNIIQNKENETQNIKLNIDAKIISKNGDNIELSINKINNQNPTEFIKSTKSTNNQTIVTNKANEKILETNFLKQNFNAEFIAKDFLSNIKSDNPDTVKEITKLINNLSLSLKIKSVTTPEKTSIEQNNNQINIPANHKKIDISNKDINIEKLYQNIKNLIETNCNKPINVEVIKQLPDNKVVVKSEIGNLIINNQTNLKTGDKLEIEINKLIENNKLEIEKLDFFDEKLDIKTPKKWDSLDKIITHLKNAGENKTAEIINNKIPNFKKDILSNMIKYIKAAKENDASIWFGKDVIDIIKEKLPNAHELLNNLERDIEKSSFRVEHMGSEWKIINIPFIDEDALVKIRAIIKQYDKYKEQKNKNKNKKHKEIETGARFIIDTNFSMLGAFQFDGLSFEENKKFDLILRTEKKLNDNIINHIINIFKSTIREFNYKGSIFINQKDKFITIEEKNIIDIVEDTDKLYNQGIWV